MNIFVLDKNLEKCARYHTDKHVVKMILESAQMLSTTIRLSGIDKGYKITHKNHPCNRWVRESLSNWKWLKKLALQLNEEYKFRYNKTEDHKSAIVIKKLPLPNIKDVGLTPFSLAVPSDCKMKDPIKSYRRYYKWYKQHLAKWTNRRKPDWYRV